MMICRSVVAVLVFLFWLTPSTAQEHIFLGQTGKAAETRLPDEKVVLDAQSQVRKMMEQVDSIVESNRPVLPDMPAVEALPQPQAPVEDISSIVEKYKNVGLNHSAKPDFPELLVMVSLSMPENGLDKLIDQAGRAGATLVFRGIKGGSMQAMGKEIARLLKGRNVKIAIHPPAFQQFSIKQVPAFVLAANNAGNVLEDGCARQDTFVKVSGDVTLDYALEHIESHSPQWSATAQAYRLAISDPRQ